MGFERPRFTRPGFKRPAFGVPHFGADILLETTHDTATLDPSITVSAGAPTPQWTVIESDGEVYTYTGNSISHTRQTAGDMTLRLGPASLGPYVTDLVYSAIGWNSTHGANFIKKFPNLEGMYGFSNPNLQINVSISDFPASIFIWYVVNTNCAITGDISNLPAGFAQLFLNNTPSAITGSLSDLPPGVTFFRLSETNSAVDGGSTSMSAVGIRSIQLGGLSYTQPEVDEIIDRIYTDRALFSYATPSLLIAGNNAAPSGTYQYAATPSTGLEKVYALVNDDDAEGFNTWSITYTAP